MKIGFISLGCSKNLVDTENIIGLFDDPYFSYEKDLKKCDVIIINTCGFILSAKSEAIDTILEIAEYKNQNLKKLIVCGCFVQRYFEDCLKEFPEVDAFIRIEDYQNLKEILSNLFNHEFLYEFGDNRKLSNRNYSAYLKIADGCNHYCAFCAIPYIRGKYISRSIESLVSEAKLLLEKGVKELILVAQDSTFYGYDLYKENKLVELLIELDKLDFKWIRILYMYPDGINERLLKTIKESKHILPYFDIPIQYGNDEILKLMRRRDKVSDIRNAINLIRNYFDNAIIRTTLIVGFPHETKETFNDTISLIKELKFDLLGAFTYSKEEGTKASEYDNEVPEEIANERLSNLMSIQNEIIFEKQKKYIGKEFEVLIDDYNSFNDRYIGRTYMSAPDDIDPLVYIKGNNLKIGEFYKVKIIDSKDYDLIGEVL